MKYKLQFIAELEIEAETEEEAIREGWLIKNLNNARYSLNDIEVVE
jgi:predicted transposase YbfD/YdcC